MPRPKKKRIGRPPGSKNKVSKAKQKVAAAALTVAAATKVNGNGEALKLFKEAVWATVGEVYNSHICAYEALAVLSDAQAMLNTLESQGR